MTISDSIFSAHINRTNYLTSSVRSLAVHHIRNGVDVGLHVLIVEQDVAENFFGAGNFRQIDHALLTLRQRILLGDCRSCPDTRVPPHHRVGNPRIHRIPESVTRYLITRTPHVISHSPHLVGVVLSSDTR